MFSIEGKFYYLMTLLMNLFIVNVLFTLSSMLILTIPLSLLWACRLVLNIYQNKKLFTGFALVRVIWLKLIPSFVLTSFSLLSIYFLLGSGINFISIFIASVILVYNLMIDLMILIFPEMKLMNLYRNAFLYMLAYFYKSIVVCLGFFIMAFVALKLMPIMIGMILFSGYIYLLIRLNFVSLVNGIGNQKNEN